MFRCWFSTRSVQTHVSYEVNVLTAFKPRDISNMVYPRTTFTATGMVAMLYFVSSLAMTTDPKMSTAQGAAKPAFTLYMSEMCPYAQRTWIAARELGIPFELHPMELGKDTCEDWFLKLNPLGKVPTIVRGNDVVYESLVANEYLAEVFPPGGKYVTPPLLPSSPAAKAKARIIIARSNDFVKAFFGYFGNKDQEQEATKRETFEKELRMLNDWAAAGALDGEDCGWLCGEAGEGLMTLADVTYFPFLERIDATLKPLKGWSLSEIELPALVAWMKKCRAKDSVAGTVKDPIEWVKFFKKSMSID